MISESTGKDVEGSGSWPNFAVRSRHWSARGKEHHKKTQSRQSVCRLRFEPNTSRMQVRRVLSLANLLGVLVSPTDETDI
jgi:hypothetical protein